MTVYKRFTSKLNEFAAPISIIAGIISATYFFTSWMHSREEIDKNLNGRVTVLEKNTSEMRDGIINISDQQKQILALVSRRREEHEMVN